MLKNNFQFYFVCCLLLLCFSCNSIAHKTIIISTKESINAAIKKMLPGDTLLLHAGVYRQNIEIENSGEEDLPIVIQAFPGEKVVLSGTREIKNWIKVKDNYYKAFCAEPILQLFHNRKMLMPARWPNIDSMFDKKGWVDIHTGKDSAQFTGYSWPKNYWNGAFCFAIAGEKWVVNVERVKSNNDSVLKLSGPWFNHRSGYYTGKGKGYIIKHLNALDTINEWHWQNDTVYAMLAEDPEKTGGIEGQVKTVLINAENISDVVVKNISVFGGRIAVLNSENIIFDNVDVSFGTLPKSYEYSNSCTYAAVSFNGESKNCVLKNSVIKGNWSGGVYLSGEGNVVYNCEVSDCNWMGNGSAAVGTDGKDHVIMNCDLFNSGKFLVTHSYTENLSVKYNHLYNGGYLGNDLGMTYAYRTRARGSEIAYNWIHDNHAENAGVGIYIDVECHDFLIHHNVIWNCSNGIQTIMNAFDHQLYNNTVWNCTKAINFNGAMGSNMYNQRVYNNLANDVFNPGLGDVRYNLTVGLTQFIDWENHDFRLVKNAKAIDYGTYIEGITKSFTGAKPDAGAYEFGEVWVPGYDSTCVYAD